MYRLVDDIKEDLTKIITTVLITTLAGKTVKSLVQDAGTVSKKMVSSIFRKKNKK